MSLNFFLKDFSNSPIQEEQFEKFGRTLSENSEGVLLYLVSRWNQYEVWI